LPVAALFENDGDGVRLDFVDLFEAIGNDESSWSPA
jgi:hypothetical protein